MTATGILLLSGVWYYDFNIRYHKTINSIAYEYNSHKTTHDQCKHLDKSRFSASCGPAETHVRESLEGKAWRLTWEASHLCGAHTCVDWFFGTQSTALNISLRFLGLAVITGILVLGYIFVTRGIHVVDTMAKERSTAKNMILMRRAINPS